MKVESIDIRFKCYGNEKQALCAKYWASKDVTDIVYGGAKASGKTYLGCSLIFGTALMYDGTFFFIARKQLNDLRKYTIPSIREVFGNWGLDDRYYHYQGNDNFFELYNKSRVYLLDAKYLPSDPLYMRFGSMQMTGGMIEEAGEFSLEAKNNLQASIGRWKNKEYNLPPKLLQTCNPSQNYLYSDYYKPNKEGNLPEWKRFIQAFPTDNKRLPDGYLLNLERSLTRNQKERLLFGNWEFNDDPDVLVDYDSICDLFTNDHCQKGNKIISADLAMKGRDRFVAGVRDGDIITIEIDKQFSPAKEIEIGLNDLKKKHNIGNSQIVADSDGLGQYLESYINNIKEFHGGASAVDKEYFNIKSECAYKLAEKINNRQLKLICTKEQEEIIKDELGVLKAMGLNNDTQKKRIIPKEEMKKLLGHSPDYLDMLIMAMYFEIKPKSSGIRRSSFKL